MVLLCAAVQVPAAQEEEGLGLVLVEEVVGAPSGALQYESAVKEMGALLAKHHFEFSNYVYVGDDMMYYTVYPVGDWEGVTKVFAAWEGFVEQWGKDNAEKFTQTWAGSFERFRMSLYRHRPDLSYESDTMPVKLEDAKYLYWGFCEIIPGHDAAVEEIFKKFVAVFAEKELPTAWRTWQADFGADQPALVYEEWGTSAGQFWMSVEKVHEKAGEEAEKLWGEMLPHLRGYHHRTVMFRPDLSYKAGKAPSEE